MGVFSLFFGLIFGLIVSTYGGIQTKAADTERQTDIKSLQAFTEAYYANQGKYPTLTDMNSTSWRSQNMKGLDAEAFKDPAGSSQQLVATPTKGSYSYVTTGDKGKACDDVKVDCTQYALTAILDDGKPFVENSLN